MSGFFIIVGAHKCGTTSIYDTLCLHPKVSGMSVKEPHFLVAEDIKNKLHSTVVLEEDYLTLVNNAKNAQPETSLTGEASVFYLYYHTTAIRNIKKYFGKDVKIIICVRNPIKRAHSAYLDEVSKGSYENLSFYESLIQEGNRIENDKFPPSTHYINVSRYADSIDAYKKNFNDVHIIQIEKLVENSTECLNELQRFLCLDPVELELKKSNVGGLQWKNKMLGALIKNLVPNKIRPKLKALAPRGYKVTKKLIVRIFQNKADAIADNEYEILRRELGKEVERLNRDYGIDYTK